MPSKHETKFDSNFFFLVSNLGSHRDSAEGGGGEVKFLESLKPQQPWLFLHSTSIDAASNRDEESGSFLIEAFCQVLQEMGKTHPLDHCLREVQKRTSQIAEGRGVKQCPELVTECGTCDIYLKHQGCE